jgi:hypothetical protein
MSSLLQHALLYCYYCILLSLLPPLESGLEKLRLVLLRPHLRFPSGERSPVAHKVTMPYGNR